MQLHSTYADHTQMNFLRMQNSKLYQDIEFLCDKSVIYGDAELSDENKLKYATVLMTHNHKTIDLSKGERLGPNEGYMDKIIYKDDFGKPIFNVTIEFDGCMVSSQIILYYNYF